MRSQWRLFAYDSHFDHADRVYTEDERWDILNRLGFAGAYLSVSDRTKDAVWQKCLTVQDQAARTGLPVIALFAIVNLDDPEPINGRSVFDLLKYVPDGSTLELALHVGWQKDLSDPRHDDKALSFLSPLVKRAAEKSVTVSLSHHFGFWLERIDDCVRISEKAAHAALRVSFSGYHWYAADRNKLAEKLRKAKPYLHLASVSGAAVTEEGADYPLPARVLKVGEGDFPLTEFVTSLKSISYSGPVGFQGYLLGGDPEETLMVSRNAFRKVEKMD